MTASSHVVAGELRTSKFFTPSRLPEVATPAFDASLEPFKSARARYEDGRITEALNLLEPAARLRPQELFLRARCLQRLDRSREAAAAFSSAARLLPVLADRCHMEAASACEAAGDRAAALVHLRAIAERSSLYREARRGIARLSSAEGDDAAAIEALLPLAQRAAPAWGADPFAEALAEVARLQEKLGRREAAAGSFLTLWSEHPLARASEGAREDAERLGGRPSAEHILRRADLLMEGHQSKDALALLEPLLLDAPTEDSLSPWHCRARFVAGKALRKMRRHTEALVHLRLVVERCESEEVWPRAAYVAGISGAIVSPDEGAEHYRRLFEEAADHPFADDALFFGADVLSRQGKIEDARRLLLKLALLYPDGDYRAEGLFKLAWLARKEGAHAEALRVLDQLVDEYAASSEFALVLERALYWRGRTLIDLGRLADGVAALEALAASRPASFYALLARDRINRAVPEKRASVRVAFELPFPADLPVVPPADGSPQFAAAVELWQMGFREDAVAELMAAERVPLRRQDPPVAFRWMASVLRDAGQERLALGVARWELRGDLVGLPTPETSRTWSIAFPRGYRDLVERHAAEAKIDPDLLQALMREESSLDPRIQSWAGAVGLCQLMPGTARLVARDLKAGRVTMARLYDPSFNLRLGAHYLAGLISRFDGNTALAVAAYNAGPGAVARWTSERDPAELDVFVEEIPIAETRNYVKKVLQSYAAYQLLYPASARPSDAQARVSQPSGGVLY